MRPPSLKSFREEKMTLIEYLEQIDRHLVEQAINETEGNVAVAARILGISRGAIDGKMRKFGLTVTRSVTIAKRVA